MRLAISFIKTGVIFIDVPHGCSREELFERALDGLTNALPEVILEGLNDGDLDTPYIDETPQMISVYNEKTGKLFFSNKDEVTLTKINNSREDFFECYN